MSSSRPLPRLLTTNKKKRKGLNAVNKWTIVLEISCWYTPILLTPSSKSFSDTLVVLQASAVVLVLVL